MLPNTKKTLSVLQHTFQTLQNAFFPKGNFSGIQKTVSGNQETISGTQGINYGTKEMLLTYQKILHGSQKPSLVIRKHCLKPQNDLIHSVNAPSHQGKNPCLLGNASWYRIIGVKKLAGIATGMFLVVNLFFRHWELPPKLFIRRKLGGVGPIDNRPSTNNLHYFVSPPPKKKYYMWQMTCDMWHVTLNTWHITCDMLWQGEHSLNIRAP